MATETAPTVESARAAATRARILDAARAEFAAVGFGGGRVDRIASSAGVNKERIYAYFVDKKSLFAAAIGSAVADVVRSVGREASDIVDLAGRVFDFIGAHPDTVRLLTWARLETQPWDEATRHLGDLPPLPELLIAEWQAQGELSEKWIPSDLYRIVWGLCEVWHIEPFRPEGGDASDAPEHRRALVTFIAGLLARQENPPGR